MVRSLTERLRRQFNVAVAEVAHHDAWQRAGLGVVAISTDAAHVEKQLAALGIDALDGANSARRDDERERERQRERFLGPDASDETHMK